MSNKRFTSYYGKANSFNNNLGTFGQTIHDGTISATGYSNLIQQTYNITNPSFSSASTSGFQILKFANNYSVGGTNIEGVYTNNAVTVTVNTDNLPNTLTIIPNQNIYPLSSSITIIPDIVLYSSSTIVTNTRFYKLEADITIIIKIDNGTSGLSTDLTTYIGSYHLSAINNPTITTSPSEVLYSVTENNGIGGENYYTYFDSTANFEPVNLSINSDNQFEFTINPIATINYSLDVIIITDIIAFDITGSKC
jgi:hypothetical protein